jgi:hypothetical protein
MKESTFRLYTGPLRTHERLNFQYIYAGASGLMKDSTFRVYTGPLRSHKRLNF